MSVRTVCRLRENIAKIFVFAVPGPGRTYLTIPVAAEAYGHRAREFDLVPLRVGPRKTLILARRDASGNLTTMYVLVTEATIPEDPKLIPFDDIFAGARDSAEAFYDEALKAALT